MTSFNHYALGAVADWLHRTVAGLAPATPGYRRIEVRPIPGGGLTSASARHRTPYGMAEVAWKIDDGKIALEVEVPANASATVHLPGKEDAIVEVGSGRHTWSYAFEAPEMALPKLTLDSTLGEVADHPAAHERIAQVLMDHNRIFYYLMEGQTDVTLRQAIVQNPNAAALEARILEALAYRGE
jgi:alpha-L-rhamnosidase